ncbi:MAG: Smr/MutS family protein [Deltaproteobacteria bacterium]|jgi:DNA mismatch repair protein MutS2|nr:Smr/MutS family protein [Deltaproteobacteria bacterium]
MGFTVAQSTLESLEWTRVVDALRTFCRTPLGRLRLAEGSEGALFEDEGSSVLARLRETSEARTLLDHDAAPPLGGCADLAASLRHSAKGGVLEPTALLEIRQTIEAVHATRRYFERQGEACPTLSAIAERLETLPDLEAQIGRCLDPSGEVRDAASQTLARARRESHQLSGELQGRIERTLHHPDVAPHLSDQFYTVRSGRFVLPVKADSKGRVRGIVHDASRSGTTLFVEPEAMVDLNNRHRQAELTVERETLRVLRELSGAVAREAEGLRTNGEICTELDLAFARGELSRHQDAVEPTVGHEGIFELPGLRHPLIERGVCVANDLRVGQDFVTLILSGPNAGGKTVALKSMALAALFVRAGLHVPADPGARVDLVGRVLADIGDHQDIRESLSTFSAAMANLAGILRAASADTLVCLDEIGVGTDPSEGAAIAQAALEALAESGARTVTTTHFNLLKEMAEVDERFENASVEFDPETLAPTYRVRIGAPGASSATTVAARMGMPRGVLERASGLLDREDRRLDRMLAELAASRALLESEQAAAQSLRLESERTREEYRQKLARLQERRDKLFGEMRRELDDSFRSAHGEVARIIAELQRQPSSQRAASARARLESLRAETERSQQEQGLAPEGALGSAQEATPETRAIDWPRARVGDAVIAPGGGRGRLLSLPDRRGRVQVQVAGAKLRVDRDQLAAAPDAGTATATDRSAPPRTEASEGRKPLPPARLGGTTETDLRGLRVEEALERLEAELDLAAAQGRDEIRVVHGIGTGALKRAVREHLSHSSYVVEWLEADRADGGAGATRGVLRKD